jgi:hypothetical protein
LERLKAYVRLNRELLVWYWSAPDACMDDMLRALKRLDD